jgi:hypothetical protein
LNYQNLSAFIWSVADLLRGDYKQSDYGKVILPFTVLRRLDCPLEPTKPKVLAQLSAKKESGLNPHPFLLRAAWRGYSLSAGGCLGLGLIMQALSIISYFRSSSKSHPARLLALLADN